MLAHCHRTGTRIQLRENGANANANRANHRAHVANVMEASLYDRSPVRTVITPDAMRELLRTSVTCHSDGRCPITQAEFAEGDAVLVLPCGHAFFKDAIQTWLETESAECPVCRHTLPSHEVIQITDAAVADADPVVADADPDADE
jgi:hypothetical protein